MSERSEVRVELPADLHARPAGRIARTAARYDATVTISTESKEIDAASVLMVMGLGATMGTEVVVRATGAEAEDAAREVAGLLAELQPGPEEPSTQNV